MTDTTGLLLAVCVHPANIQDRGGAQLLLAGVAERFPRLAKVWEVDLVVDRSGAAADADRRPGLAAAVGGRADLRLVGPVSPVE